MIRILIATLLIGASFSVHTAKAWDPFITPNANVEEGNRSLGEEDYAQALSAYDRAAVELPDNPRVQLNRGLALLGTGELDRAREAFLRATTPEADDSIRADAYYNLGLAFYQQGDQAATAEDHETAQAQFREAADAFRRSLRVRPGDRDTAWNLELALRRIQEQEQAQEEQEQQEEEENQEDENENEGENQEEQQEGQEGDEQNPDQEDEGQDSADNNQDQENPDEESEPDQADPNQDDGQGENEEPEPQDGEDPTGENEPPEPDGSEGGDGGDQQDQQSDSGGREIPDDVARVLDSLANSEESLDRHRARARARQENRRVTMDW